MNPGWRGLLFSAVMLIGLAGCSPALPKTHPVSGSVVDQNGKPIKGGGTIHFLSASDPSLRIVGDIKPNGSFVLRTIRDHEQAPGAPQGEYEVTIQPPAVVDPGGAKRVVEPIVVAQKHTVQAGENQMKIEIPMKPPP